MCFSFLGATFCGQLLVREKIRRRVAIVSHLQSVASLISAQIITFAVCSSSQDAWCVSWQCVLDNNNIFLNENHEIHLTNRQKKTSDKNGP